MITTHNPNNSDKFHIVEKHVIEFIDATRQGLGHFSEV